VTSKDRHGGYSKVTAMDSAGRGSVHRSYAHLGIASVDVGSGASAAGPDTFVPFLRHVSCYSSTFYFSYVC